MKYLYLARHAKSDWNTPTLSDFDRPLNQRGLNDAKRMGERLAKLDWIPQRILCSPAERAKQTGELFCQYAKISRDVMNWKKEIYACNASMLLKLISSVPESVNSLMLIGHNPAIEWLLLDLCSDVPAKASGKIVTTANIAKISLSEHWDNLQGNGGQLVDLLRPKDC
jgi:phosphohistidine phosphatase